jgi:hypothetical protein
VGKEAIIVRALCELKSAGASFCNHLAAGLHAAFGMGIVQGGPGRMDETRTPQG